MSHNAFISISEDCHQGCEIGDVCVRPYGWANPHFCIHPSLLTHPLTKPCLSPDDDRFLIGFCTGAAVVVAAVCVWRYANIARVYLTRGWTLLHSQPMSTSTSTAGRVAKDTVVTDPVFGDTINA